MAEGSSSLSKYHSEGRAAPREASHRLTVGPLFTASSLNHEGSICPGLGHRWCQPPLLTPSLNSLCPRPAKSSSRRITPRPGGAWGMDTVWHPVPQPRFRRRSWIRQCLSWGPVFLGLGGPSCPGAEYFLLRL